MHSMLSRRICICVILKRYNNLNLMRSQHIYFLPRTVFCSLEILTALVKSATRQRYALGNAFCNISETENWNSII